MDSQTAIESKFKTLILTYFIQNKRILLDLIQNVDQLQFLEFQKAQGLFNLEVATHLDNPNNIWNGYFYSDVPSFIPDNFSWTSPPTTLLQDEEFLSKRLNRLLDNLVSPSEAADILFERTFMQHICVNKNQVFELRLDIKGIKIQIFLDDEVLEGIIGALLYYSIRYRVPYSYIQTVLSFAKTLFPQCLGPYELEENKEI